LSAGTLRPGAGKKTLIYQFITAAEIHRNYVLDDLLPKHGIVLHEPSPT